MKDLELGALSGLRKRLAWCFAEVVGLDLMLPKATSPQGGPDHQLHSRVIVSIVSTCRIQYTQWSVIQYTRALT